VFFCLGFAALLETSNCWQTRRRKWHAWMECGEMGISAAMRAYVDLVAQLSPSWGLDSRLVSGSAGGGKEEEDDITMAYYFLGHEAIDALYNYGRQEAVPMQAPYD